MVMFHRFLYVDQRVSPENADGFSVVQARERGDLWQRHHFLSLQGFRQAVGAHGFAGDHSAGPQGNPAPKIASGYD